MKDEFGTPWSEETITLRHQGQTYAINVFGMALGFHHARGYSGGCDAVYLISQRALLQVAVRKGKMYMFQFKGEPERSGYYGESSRITDHVIHAHPECEVSAGFTYVGDDTWCDATLPHFDFKWPDRYKKVQAFDYEKIYAEAFPSPEEIGDEPK
ncbi:MAG: hypothetical protein U1F77_20015 [Kiritimatiellia bacterium]